MALDPHGGDSMGELPYNDDAAKQTLSQRESPCCPSCGSTLLKEPFSDSHVFSRVLTVAITRMSMIARETIQDEKLLHEDKDAMVGILENVCLMKSTIRYLLNEMCHDFADEADDDSPFRSGGSYQANIIGEEENDNEGEDQGFKKLHKGGNQGFDSCRDQLMECSYFSRTDDDGGDDDDLGSSGSVIVLEDDDDDDKEKERAIMTISRGLIGGIATMSIIAKYTSETKKIMLAEDKEALVEMLHFAQMVKLMI